jgi:hypothetical protein
VCVCVCREREREIERVRAREKAACIPLEGRANLIVPIQLVVKREILLDRHKGTKAQNHKFLKVSAHKWDSSA